MKLSALAVPPSYAITPTRFILRSTKGRIKLLRLSCIFHPLWENDNVFFIHHDEIKDAHRSNGGTDLVKVYGRPSSSSARIA